MPESGAIYRVRDAMNEWLTARVPDAIDFVQLRADLTHILSCIPAGETVTEPAQRNYRKCLNGSHRGDGLWLYCILALGHAGAHQSGSGVIWPSDPETPLCDATCRSMPPSDPDWACVLDAGHQGHHSMADGHHWHSMKAAP